MGTQERRTRERLEQRHRILDAALELIVKDGFAALSMRKLAERIEYSPASIYLYFESREQIAKELCEQGFRQLLEGITVATAGKEGKEALQALSSAYVDFGLQHPAIYRLIFMGDSEYMAAAYAEQNPEGAASSAYGLLLKLAEELKAKNLVNEETDLGLVADLIWCTLHGIVSLRITCAYGQNSSTESLVALATEVLLRGLANRPNRTRYNGGRLPTA